MFNFEYGCDYLTRGRLHPRRDFFQQAVLDREIDNQLLQCPHLPVQILDLAG